MKKLVVIGVILFFTGSAYSYDTGLELVSAIQSLQPYHGLAEAASWAAIFDRAGEETNLDPKLLVAISFRESSLRRGVVGTRGEVGPMQLHGLALRYRPGRCDPRTIGCSIRGGASYLRYCKATCGGSWNVWVGAYGMSRCPSEQEAEELPSVERARRIYQRIGGTQWE